MARARRWVFTLNNYAEADEAAVAEIDCKYVVYGREKGASGTPHLQGFVVFAQPMRLGACKKLLPRAHWEVARGNNVEAATYCKKDGDVVERGQLPDDTGVAGGQMEQQRWKDSFAAAKRGAFEDIPEDILVRHYRTWKEIRKDYMDKPDDCADVTGVWFHGPPGVGKSHRARAEYPGAYLKMQNKWWDGYQNEDFVIIDDFDSKEMGHLIKIWADKYSFLAETKGGAIHIRPKKIIITSNYHPADMMWSDAQMRDAIERRFECIRVTQYEPPTLVGEEAV